MSVLTHKTEVEPQVRVGVPAQRTAPAARRVPRHRPPTRQRVAGAPRVLARVACAPRQARLSLVWVLVVATAACAAVMGLGALANSVGPTVPSETTVVRVKPGENLWDVAGRVAPDSNADAVVERIQELNGIDGAVEPGQPLTVPFER